MRSRLVPPRLARWLLMRVLPHDVRDAIVGDLDEIYRQRPDREASWRTAGWYWGQALSFAVRFTRERIRERLQYRHRHRSRASTDVRPSWRNRLAGAGGSWLDVKLALRMLVKYPGLSLVGGFAIAVGIAVTAGYFELGNKLIDAELPLEDGDRIIAIRDWDLAAGRPEHRSMHDFIRWREELRSVQDLGAHQVVFRNLITTDGRAEPVRVSIMSASGFRIARIPPLLGRPLLESDEQPGAPPVAVFGYDLWQTRMGADSSVVGQTIRIGASRATVVGVMPKAFLFPVRDNLWVPLEAPRTSAEPLSGPEISLFGRLAPDATLAQAQSELSTLGARRALNFPEAYAQIQPRLMRYTHTFFDPSDRWMLYAVDSFLVMVLVVACINVATLVFARTAMRQSELAVRITLGASRARIVSQLFIEVLVLSLIAAAGGLMAARWGVTKVMVGEGMLSALPFWWDVGMPPSTVLLSLALAVLAAGIAGIVPALKVTGGRGHRGLHQLIASTKELRFGRFSTAVIVVQVAASVAFLSVGFGMGRQVMTFHTGTGDLPDHSYLAALMRMDREPPPNADQIADRAEFATRYAKTYEELARRITSAAGMEGVTFADALPGMAHRRLVVEVEASSRPTRTRPSGSVSVAQIDPAFFDALGTPIVSGRRFTSADLESDSRVVIVNEPFVRRFLEGRSPIGHRLRMVGDADEEPEPWYEIVGVVQDLGMNPSDPGDASGLYYPVTPRAHYPLFMAVRLRPDHHDVAGQLRRMAVGVDPTLRLEQLMPLREAGRVERAARRFAALMVTVVAGMILMLSMAGIYALMAFAVSQRSREIGIRTALGAHPRRILTAIFARGLGQLAIGIALGSIVAIWFYGFAEWLDGGTDALVVVTVVMLTSGVLACAVPARRALRVQPTEALRET